MGNRSPAVTRSDICKYFRKKEKMQMRKFSKIEGYLENSGEWISYVKNRLQTLDIYWAHALINLIENWDVRADRWSKSELIWLRYIDKSAKLSGKSKTRTCLQDVHTIYRPFESTIYCNVYKSLLYTQLTTEKSNILNKINTVFADSLGKQYLDSIIAAEASFTNYEYLDEIMLDLNSYIQLLEEIMPQFYPQIFNKIQSGSMDQILRNSMIRDKLFAFLIRAFKAAYKEKVNSYKFAVDCHKNLTFTEVGCSEMLSLGDGLGYSALISNLSTIESSDKLMDIIDVIGGLDYNIRNSIDSFYPNGNFLITSDDLLPVLIKLVIVSELNYLPAYLEFIKQVGRSEELCPSIQYFVQMIGSAVQGILSL